MGERTNRALPRVLLSLSAALLLAFVIGYIGVSGLGGEPIGVEKASPALERPEQALRGDPRVSEGKSEMEMPAVVNYKVRVAPLLAPGSGPC